jgi:GPH family glycoside/pentoside/hexuronide:cation symporter
MTPDYHERTRVMAFWGFFTMAGNFCLAWYIVVYYVCGGDTDRGSWLNAANGVGFQIVGFASIPVISWLAGRYGKKRALFVILALAAAGALVKWFIYTPDAPYLLLFDSVLSGPIWTALAILAPSMMADLCDVDEYQYGKRREGVFGAVFSWMQKFGSSLTFLLAGLVLWLSGFNEKLVGIQPVSTVFWMRAFFVGSSLLAMIAGMAFLWFYNVSEQRAYEVRGLLEDRRGKV